MCKFADVQVSRRACLYRVLVRRRASVLVRRRASMKVGELYSLCNIRITCVSELYLTRIRYASDLD